MLDSQLQTRFAKSCGDAAIGYATAASSAYGDFFARYCDFWLDVLSSSTPGSDGAKSSSATTTRSNPTKGLTQPCAFSAPAFGFPDVKSANPFAAWNPWAAAMPNPWAMFSQPSAMTPFNSWMDVLQGRGSPTAWPMALAMMSAGVPSGVAWPTAEANLAALDAAELAKESVNRAFSTFRSGGGHASTPVVTPSAEPHAVVVTFAAVPISLGLMSAWLPFWHATIPT